jgi:hypothetical protein
MKTKPPDNGLLSQKQENKRISPEHLPFLFADHAL